MLKLFQWDLVLRQVFPVGLGIVSGHPKLPEGTHILSALWAGADARIQDAPIGLHLGMFQDSYLIQGIDGEPELDFRLFPMRNRLEPYHISEGVKFLLIRNEGRTDIAYGSPAESILCPPGAAAPIPVQPRIV